MTRSTRYSLPGVSFTHKKGNYLLIHGKKNLDIRVDFKEVNQKRSPVTNKVGITLGHAHGTAACQHKDIFSHHIETEIGDLK